MQLVLVSQPNFHFFHQSSSLGVCLVELQCQFILLSFLILIIFIGSVQFDQVIIFLTKIKKNEKNTKIVKKPRLKTRNNILFFSRTSSWNNNLKNYQSKKIHNITTAKDGRATETKLTFRKVVTKSLFNRVD